MGQEIEVPVGAGLDKRERSFVGAFVRNGGNGRQAAIAAGYAPSGAASVAARLLDRPDVHAAIEAELRQRLDELTPAALSVLERLMSDEAVHPKIRLAAAVAILDRGRLQRSERREVDVIVSPAKLIQEVWKARQERLAAQSNGPAPQVIDISPEVPDEY